MEDRVHLTIENGVADVRLARPGKLNALDPHMFEALAEVGARLKQNGSVRAENTLSRRSTCSTTRPKPTTHLF